MHLSPPCLVVRRGSFSKAVNMSSIVKQIAKLESERTALKQRLKITTPDTAHPGNIVKRLSALTAEVQGLRARAAGRVAVPAILAPPSRPAPTTPAQTEEAAFWDKYHSEPDTQIRSRMWRMRQEKLAKVGAK